MREMFQRSHQTDKLIDLFRECSVGTSVSFATASKVVGFTLTSSSPTYHSARNIAAKKHNIIIEGVRGFGFVRLDPTSIVKRGSRHLRSIRRRAHRAGHEMEVAISGNLDREHMIKATEQLSRFRIVETTAQPVRAVTNRKVEETPTPLKPTNQRSAIANM